MFEPGGTFKLNVVMLLMAVGFFGYVLLLAPGPEPATSDDTLPGVLTQPAATRPAARATDPMIGVILSPSATSSATPSPTLTATPTSTPSGTPTPTVERPTATATTPPLTQHTVEPGEVLSSIAARYGVTVEAIVEANELEDPNQLAVGQVLVIPAP